MNPAPASIIDFVRLHPYFFANVLPLTVFLLLPWCLRRREYGQLAFLSGLLCLPFGFVALSYNDVYWQPLRLGGLPLGIEDFIFTYTVGVSTWLASAWRWRDTVARAARVRAAAGRLLIWVAPCVVLTTALWLAGVDPMTITTTTAFALLLALLVRRRRLWPLAAAGLLVFPVPYLLMIGLQFFIWPDYVSYWRQDMFWARPVLGIPIGEVAWIAAFAGLWPVFVASALDVEPRPKQPPEGYPARR